MGPSQICIHKHYGVAGPVSKQEAGERHGTIYSGCHAPLVLYIAKYVFPGSVYEDQEIFWHQQHKKSDYDSCQRR